jgi:hypothetical protein
MKYALYCHTVFKGYFSSYAAAAQAAADMGVTSQIDIVVAG